MAIKLTYYTIAIPVSIVLSKFSLEKWTELNNISTSWDDGNLYAIAAMDPGEIDFIINRWEKFGFLGKRIINNEEHWIDFCVAETNTKCNWLSYTEDGIAAIYLTGTQPGEVIWPAPKEIIKKQEKFSVSSPLLMITAALALGFILFLKFFN